MKDAADGAAGPAGLRRRERPLAAKIQQALSYYEAGNASAACSEPGQVISEARAQSGKHLTVAQASEILAEATQIR